MIVDQGEVLLTLAEVAVAFAGFSGVVAVFGRRDPTSWSFADRVRFSSLVASSLSLLLLCILPFTLLALQIPEESVWRGLSAFVAVYFIVSNVFFVRRMRAASASERAELTVIVLRVFRTGQVLVVILSVYNAVLVGEFGLFLAALTWLLIQSGFLFARMLISGFGVTRAA